MQKSKTLFYWLTGLIIVLGITFRTIAFSYCDAFQDDECRLISAFLEKNYWQMFLALGDAQSAPPLFIIPIRLLGTLLGFSERVIKFIPFACSIASLFVFYKLATKFFSRKYSVLVSLLLFAINIKLIIFSSIFKQYSSDVLIFMLGLYYLPQINIAKLSSKSFVGLCITVLLLPLCSLPSLFLIGALLIINIYNNFKNTYFYKKLAILLFQFLVLMSLYYIFNLAPSKLSFEEYFPNYWDDGFINLTKYNILTVFTLNFKYFFYPNSYTFFELGLFLIGIYFCFRKNNDLTRYIFVVFGLIILASCLHIYPFVGRVALYFVPVFILLLVKPLDEVKIGTAAFYLVIICFLAGFCGYNHNYFKSLTKEETFITYSPKVLMKVLKPKFDPKTEVILCNSASSSSFIFYSSAENFHTDKIYEIPVYSDENLLEYLNGLEPSNRYWLYLIKDFINYKQISTIQEWSKKQKVLFEQYDRKSCLILIEKS